MDKENKKGEYYDKIPQLHEEGPSKFKDQMSKGFGAILIIGISILLYFAFLRLAEIFHGFSFVMNLLTPLIYGLVFAYLLNPMVKRIEGFFISLGGEVLDDKKDVKRGIRIGSIFISLTIFLLFIFFLFYLVIPEVAKSAYNLIIILPDQISAVIASISQIEFSDGYIATEIEEIAIETWGNVKQWLQTDLLAQANSIMSNVTVGVVTAIDWVLDVIMGLILAIYLLMSKDLFLGQAKKTIYALMPIREANIALHILKKSNGIFGGFIIGKILDSMLMGVISFFVLSILNMPYVLLVSVIIGVTNVIPYFGPFIGGIPCAILILLASPIQGVYFIIYIIVLQQIDGNIIGPKILGDSTGLSPFWVIIAVMLGGGLFGFVGMVIGVPTFAVVYYIVGLFINQKLQKKNLPTDSIGYGHMSYVDVVTGEFVPSDMSMNPSMTRVETQEHEEEIEEKLEEKLEEEKEEV